LRTSPAFSVQDL